MESTVIKTEGLKHTKCDLSEDLQLTVAPSSGSNCEFKRKKILMRL